MKSWVSDSEINFKQSFSYFVVCSMQGKRKHETIQPFITRPVTNLGHQEGRKSFLSDSIFLN